jgi:hypothetical protein
MGQAALRLTSPAVREIDLHASVAEALDQLLLPPAEWTTFAAGHMPLSPQYAAKLARLGLKRGWPDIQVVHQQLYGLELKVGGGALSRTTWVRTKRGTLRELIGQADMFPRLERAGMRIAICRSVDEVFAALADWGVPFRRYS